MLDNLPPHRRYLATYTTDHPEVHRHHRRTYAAAVLDEYDDRMMVGEISTSPSSASSPTTV